MTRENEGMGRRQFLSATGLAGLAVLKPQLVRGTAANSAIRLGLLGCGNRGTYVATSFANHTNVRVVALADLFQDQLDKGKQHFDDLAAQKGYAGIDPRLMFRGPKAYQTLANCPEIDMIQISTPDIFHPQHLQAAVNAGKHTYCEKPVAVDVSGCKRVVQIGEQVGGRFSLDIGFQLRSVPPYVELVRRIHAGGLGKISTGAAAFHATGNFYPPRPQASPLELRIRNFFWDRVIGGDIIVDQGIHLLDLCNWMLNAHPVKAIGTGGRGVREDAGDCWDHFDVVYTYPRGVQICLNHFQGGKALFDASIRMFGSKGVAELHYEGVVGLYGDEPWEWEGSAGPGSPRPGHANIYAQGEEAAAERVAGVFHSALEHADTEKEKAFVDSITSGKFHNQAATGAEAALTAILGRTAAYTGREITWDELVASGQTYDPELEGIDLSEFN